MRKLFSFVAAIALATLMAGCGGGNRPPAPANVTVTPHDSSAVVSWNMDSGVEYWVWLATGSTVTVSSCGQGNCRIFRNVSSPYLVTGLTNGTTYSVIVNGTSDGSPVSESSPTVTFVPRPAGAVWTQGVPVTGTLLGVANTVASGVSGSAFMAVGSAGVMYKSADATTWTALTSGVATNLNAVQYGNGRFVVAGDAGLIISSADAASWTAAASGTGNNLYSLAVAGGLIVAVGAGGTIVTSSDGLTWTVRSSGTTKDLYGVRLVNGILVAVGANGTLLTSSNGVDWVQQSLPATVNLKSVAYGAGTYVAVGADGALVTSTDGVAWTVRTPIAAMSFNDVLYGTQFVAVGSGGGIFTSADGVSWTAAASGTTSDLNALTFSAGNAATLLQIGYIAVGAAGVNLTSF